MCDTLKRNGIFKEQRLNLDLGKVLKGWRLDGFDVRLREGYEPAFTNFQAMSMSVKKTYTRAYFDAKTDAGREKRIAWMADRLNKNLKPM
jgi:hypothetical protein